MHKQLIHRFWGGEAPIPSAYAEYGSEWENLNPGWAVKDWGEEVVQIFDDLRAVVNDLYERSGGEFSSEFYSSVSGVVQYALVRDFGGVFVPVSEKPRKIDSNLPEMAWRAGNSIIGAPTPNDPFWVGLVAELPYQYFMDRLTSSEPGFVENYSQRMPGFLAVISDISSPLLVP